MLAVNLCDKGVKAVGLYRQIAIKLIDTVAPVNGHKFSCFLAFEAVPTEERG